MLDVGGFWDWVEAYPHMWPESPGVERRRGGFAQPEQILELTELMLRAGWSDDDVRGVLGENFARVYERVWDAPGAAHDDAGAMPNDAGGTG